MAGFQIIIYGIDGDGGGREGGGGMGGGKGGGMGGREGGEGRGEGRGGGKGGREGGGGKGDEEKVHFTKHFTKEGREMSRYYTLVQGKRTGLRSNKLAAPSDAKLVFCFFFFSSARLLKKRSYAIDKMHRSLRVAIPSPPPAKVKRKRRNVYENPNRTLLIVLCDDTINYAI